MLLPEAGPGLPLPAGPDRTSRPRPTGAIPAHAAHSFRAVSSVSGPSCSWHGHAAWLRARTVIRYQAPEGGTMSTPTKPSIVFCHGIWADGSCWNKLTGPLQAEGYEVIAAQYGLDTNEADVAATRATLSRVHSPAILVGHSYGGAVITGAGIDVRVAGLVYISALAPDETETSEGQQEKFPQTPAFSQIEIADGRIWMLPSGAEFFCGDLPED